MTATPPELSPSGPAVAVTAASRALIRKVGITAWAVLVDVSLNARGGPAGWAARTSVRTIADHLGLTPGTVARAVARLRTAGLVQRRDDRDCVTGRFVESVYVVGTTAGIVPCVDCPHTAERDTAGRLAADLNAVGRDAGQRLPGGMANVCRTLSGGGRTARRVGGSSRGGAEGGDGEVGQRSEEGRGTEKGLGRDRGTGDGDADEACPEPGPC